MFEFLIPITMLLGSLCAKTPQIVKIYQSRSGQGINLSSMTLDLISLTIFVAYSFLNNYPWLESLILATQTLIIVVEVLFFDNELEIAGAYILAYFVICYVLMSGMTSILILWLLQGMTIPLYVWGKALQIYTNYESGNTGQLSALSMGMLLCGSVIRVYTTVSQTGDAMLIILHGVAVIVNWILLTQIFYYRKAASRRVTINAF